MMEQTERGDFDREGAWSLAWQRHYNCREGEIEGFLRNMVSNKRMKMKTKSSYSLICLIEGEEHRGCFSEIDRTVFSPYYRRFSSLVA